MQAEAAKEAEAISGRIDSDRGGRMEAESKQICFFAMVGFLAAHAIVYRYYYPSDIVPSYSLERGFTEELAERRLLLQSVDEHVGLRVLDTVGKPSKMR